MLCITWPYSGNIETNKTKKSKKITYIWYNIHSLLVR